MQFVLAGSQGDTENDSLLLDCYVHAVMACRHTGKESWRVKNFFLQNSGIIIHSNFLLFMITWWEQKPVWYEIFVPGSLGTTAGHVHLLDLQKGDSCASWSRQDVLLSLSVGLTWRSHFTYVSSVFRKIHRVSVHIHHRAKCYLMAR